MSPRYEFALRLAICLASSVVMWRFAGPLGLPLTLPLYGVLLARPLLDLMSELRQDVRERTWAKVEGRYFAFRDVAIEVIEDERHVRWVRAADVRKITGFTASDGALALTYPKGACEMGKPCGLFLSDDALLAHLAKERSVDALKLRHWVEQEIAFPARRVRERYGVRGDDDEPSVIP